MYNFSPASEKVMEVSGNFCWNVCAAPLARRSQSFAAPSSAQVATRGGPLLAGLQLLTIAVCPFKFFICAPTSTSHSLAVLSAEAVRIFSPSVVQLSSRMAFLCPLRTMKLSHSPYTFQRNTCLSLDPEATTSPCGENRIPKISSYPAVRQHSFVARLARLDPGSILPRTWCPVRSMVGASSFEVLNIPCVFSGREHRQCAFHTNVSQASLRFRGTNLLLPDRAFLLPLFLRSLLLGGHQSAGISSLSARGALATFHRVGQVVAPSPSLLTPRPIEDRDISRSTRSLRVSRSTTLGKAQGGPQKDGMEFQGGRGVGGDRSDGSGQPRRRSRMPWSRVAQNVLLGAQEDVLDALKEGATAVVSVGVPLDLPLPEEQVLKVSLLDLEDADLLTQLPMCCDFLEKQIERGRNVLVHCAAGVSRSTAVVVAHLMRTEDLSLDAALTRIRQVRPQACPNDGFMRQLELFRRMGCKLDEENVAYRSHRAAQLAQQDNLDWHATLRDPQGAAAANRLLYRCKSCRRAIADSGSVLEHEAGSGADAFAWRKRAKEDQRNRGAGGTTSCWSVFVEPLAWMDKAADGEVRGKLHCPSCRARLGSFDWSGAQCNCGAWIRPAFQLLRSKIDEPTRNVVAVGAPIRDVPTRFRHLIFDCDGVLVDSERVSCEALRLAVKQVTGFDPPHRFPEDFVPLFGMDVRATVAYYRQTYCSNDPSWNDQEALAKQIGDVKDVLYAQIAETHGIQAFPGVEGLIRQARALGLSIAVGSSGSPAKIRMNLEKAGIYHLFDAECIVSAKTVPRGKPAPDVYLEAMRRVRCVDPSTALIVEDAVLGLKAGKAAGAFTVGVATSLPRQALEPHANVVYGALADLDLRKMK